MLPNSFPTGDATSRGLRATMSVALTSQVVVVIKESRCAATRCRIFASGGGAALYSVSFVGNIATFTGVSLSNSTTYRFECDASAAAFNQTYNATTTFPYPTESLSFIGGSNNLGDDSLMWNINAILIPKTDANLFANIYT